MDGLARLLDGAEVTLLLPGGEPALDRFFATIDRTYVQQYVEHFQARDPHVEHHRTVAPVGRFYAGVEAVPEAELVRTEFYHDWMRPQKLRPDSTFGCLFERGTPEEFSGLGAWSRRGGRASTAADLARAQIVAPHVLRAVALRRRVARLRAERDALAEVVERIPAATILVDADGRVRHANRAAERLSPGEEGIELTRDGIDAASGEAARVLGCALAGALAAVALFVSDPTAVRLPPVATARRLYGLSRAEAAPALELAAGRTLAEAATRLGVRISTARSTLKLVFARTGTSRQSELVRRLASGVGPFAAEDGEGA